MEIITSHSQSLGNDSGQQQNLVHETSHPSRRVIGSGILTGGLICAGIVCILLFRKNIIGPYHVAKFVGAAGHVGSKANRDGILPFDSRLALPLKFLTPYVAAGVATVHHSSRRSIPQMDGTADGSDLMSTIELSRREMIGTGGAFAANLQDAVDIRVADLRIYPVKSCGGISLTSSKMASTGLEFDRIFAVVDRDGFAQTQRRHRKMAAIRTGLDFERKTLTLETEGMEPLTVPLFNMESAGCQRVQTTLGHGDPVPSWLYPRPATEWLTRCLKGTPGLTIEGEERPSPGSTGNFLLKQFQGDEIYHLVRIDDTTSQRRVMNDVGGENALPEDQVAFPDLFPLLITAQESLEEVDRRVPSMQVTMDRFRPNIVVAGLPRAFDEDSWAVVEIGDGSRRLTLRCLEQDPRCQVPSIDQRTGEKDANFEPSRTLRKFRKLPFSVSGKAGLLATEGPMFGIYAAHGGKPGELRIGDKVRIVERSKSGSLHEHWSNRPSKSV